MTLAGIKMRVVGRDATLMRGRTGFDTSYETNTLVVRRRRELRRDLHGADLSVRAAAGLDTYVLYNRAYTRGDNLRRRTAAGSGPRSACIPPARSARRPTPTSTRTTRRERGDERSDDDESDHASRARAGLALGLRRPLAAGVLLSAAAARPTAAAATEAPTASGIVCTTRRRRRHQPDLQPDDPGRLHQPGRRHHRLHVGVLRGRQAVPAPRTGAVRQRGRHRHGRSSTTRSRHLAQERAGGLDRVPRPGERAGRRRAVAAAVRRRRRRSPRSPRPAQPSGGTVTYSFVAAQPGTFLYESGGGQRRAARRASTRAPRSRCGWACSAR